MPAQQKEWKTRTLAVLRIMVLLASVLLIVLISLNVFTPDLDMLSPKAYSRAQLPVCTIYIAEYLFALYCSPHRARFFRHNLLTLLICIPYMTILHALGINFTGLPAYIIHYMPMLRAVFAMVIVTRFVSTNRIVGLFAAYILILILAIYFSSLIFYLAEKGINPHVTSYMSSLWWCMLQGTTLGASFFAMTTVGKAVAMVVSGLGMLMFPLFTVYLTQTVQKYAAAKAPQSAGNS